MLEDVWEPGRGLRGLMMVDDDVSEGLDVTVLCESLHGLEACVP